MRICELSAEVVEPAGFGVAEVLGPVRFFLLFPHVVKWRVEINGVFGLSFGEISNTGNFAKTLHRIINCFSRNADVFCNFFLGPARQPQLKNPFVRCAGRVRGPAGPGGTMEPMRTYTKLEIDSILTS